MKIKRTSQVITIIVIVLSLAAIACALIARHYWIISQEAYEARRKTSHYVDQLAYGSDRLITSARAYASTGDRRYYNDFRQELNMDRNRDTAVNGLKQLGLLPAEPVQIPSIEGLDIKDGLMRVGQNRTLYLKLLRQFVEHQSGAPAQIAAALEADDWPLAERLAHTVKGVAGSLGAGAVQQAAAGELLDARQDAFRSIFPPETFDIFEKQISNFAFADASSTLQQAIKEKRFVLS